MPAAGDLYYVKANLVEETPAGVLDFAYVGDTPLTAANLLGGILVNENSDVQVTCNTNSYIVESIAINGSAIDMSKFKGAYTFAVNEDSRIDIKGRRPVVINYAINIVDKNDANKVADKDAIEVYYGAVKTPESLVTLAYPLDANDRPITTTTRFPQVTNERNSSITIKAQGEIIIDSVTNDKDVDVNYDYAGNLYTINLVDGMEITVTTEEVEYNEIMVVSIYVDPGTSGLKWEDGCASLTSMANGRSVSLNLGINQVPFNSRFDREFRYAINPRPERMHTSLDGVEIQTSEELMNMAYIVAPENGSILRSFYEYNTVLGIETYYEDVLDENGDPILDEYGNPEKIEKTREVEIETDYEFTDYEVEYDIEESIADDMLILRENFQEVDVTVVNHEIKGTHYFVYIKENSNVALAIVPAEYYASNMRSVKRRVNTLSDGTPAPDAPEGYKYVHDFIVTEPVVVKAVKSTTTTGIDGVAEVDALPEHNVYDVYGRLIKVDATDADLHDLPAGVYIFNGKKLLVH